jgi:hypothetical protein
VKLKDEEKAFRCREVFFPVTRDFTNDLPLIKHTPIQQPHQIQVIDLESNDFIEDSESDYDTTSTMP